MPGSYDDGGFSGGNMERPALKRLMEDVQAGQVDVVVVYKVDRLSRSLLDFTRIMETFEQHNVSFVSVTQQFSTTNSMGRLTLNILLSFAQFEREIISERTRDKISAAKRKGMWVGGMLMLGYDLDPKGGRLVVNAREAERVRAIFDLYLSHRAMMPVVEELRKRGWTTKRWITRKELVRGGKPFNKQLLYSLLTNMLYIGRIDYHGGIYEGQHDAIIAPEVWQQVQELLRSNGLGKGKAHLNKHGSLLRGLLYCIPCGKAMINTWTTKDGHCIYRYYVCTNAQKQGWHTCPSKSLNAHEIERAVVEQIKGLGSNDKILAETIRMVQEQVRRKAEVLTRERQVQEKDLDHMYSQVKKLAGKVTEGGKNKAENIAWLAELQDKVRASEQRITEIREELLGLDREYIEEADMAEALSKFDPIWGSLNSSEQSRILHLLVERVGYDGTTGKVVITFRSPGIKELAGGKIEGVRGTEVSQQI